MISFGLRRTFPGRLGRLNPAQLIPLRDAPSVGRERSADGWSLTETGGRSARGNIGCGVRLLASALDARASTGESCARPADLEELVLVLVALLPRVSLRARVRNVARGLLGREVSSGLDRLADL